MSIILDIPKPKVNLQNLLLWNHLDAINIMKFSKPKIYKLPETKYYFDLPVIIVSYLNWFIINIYGYFLRQDIVCLIDFEGEKYLTFGKRQGLVWSAPLYWTINGGEVIGNEELGNYMGPTVYASVEQIVLIKKYDSIWFNKSSKYKFKL